LFVFCVVSLALFSARGDTFKPAMRVVVLTWRRHRSLARLLDSLERASYGEASILLEIHFDGKRREIDKMWSKAMEVATQFHFSHGRKVIKVAKQNGGLRRAWLNAWPTVGQPGDARTLILEDDLEVSRWWFKWLSLMWKTYGHRDDLGGITLGRYQTCPVEALDGEQCEIANGHRPFLSRLVGSWGFSPNARFWKKFLASEAQWINSEPAIGDLAINVWMKSKKGSVWTLYWMKYSTELSLFTLYVTCPNQKALAIHHREKGEHNQESQGARYSLLEKWPHQWDQPMPKNPIQHGWDRKPIAR